MVNSLRNDLYIHNDHLSGNLINDEIQIYSVRCLKGLERRSNSSAIKLLDNTDEIQGNKLDFNL